MKERLQKVLSHAGICSRRKAEELIAAGQVRVNGKVIRELGSEADPVSDRIEVAGERIRPERKRYFLFYKPDNVITSVTDPQGRARSWTISEIYVSAFSLSDVLTITPKDCSS